MRSSEILTIGEAVLAEEPRDAEEAVRLMQLKVLKIGIRELVEKAGRFEGAAHTLEREASKIEKALSREFQGEF